MAKRPTTFKKGHKKKAGRKKGVPNKISREIKDIFERLAGFITDEDLWKMYNKFTRRPDLFLKVLQMMYPKDFNIKLNGMITQNKGDLNKLSENELKQYLKLTEKLENNASNNG